MTSSVDNHAGSVVGPDDDVDVQETWWTGFISPYTLRFSPELEAQYAMEHALAHRNIDIQSSLFELAADAAVLLLKKSNSLSLDLRSNFLDRWGLFLGILTLLNRGALFILWLVSPTPRVYAQRRGKVLATVRITRCILFLGWLTLNRACLNNVPCFIVRGVMLDAAVTSMLVMPFMARTRFVYHLPLQACAILTCLLLASGPMGTCSVFERYAAHQDVPPTSIPCMPLSWNTSALSSLASAPSAASAAVMPQGPGWLGGVMQSVAVAPWQMAMWGVDPDVHTTAACQSCIIRSTTDKEACTVLPQQFKAAHDVARRVLGWMLALPATDMPGSDRTSACWMMSTFVAIVLSYAVACVLYWLELRHRLAFVRAHCPNCCLHPGEQELASLVLMYQLVFMYFCVTLTWMMLGVLAEH